MNRQASQTNDALNATPMAAGRASPRPTKCALSPGASITQMTSVAPKAIPAAALAMYARMASNGLLSTCFMRGFLEHRREGARIGMVTARNEREKAAECG